MPISGFHHRPCLQVAAGWKSRLPMTPGKLEEKLQFDCLSRVMRRRGLPYLHNCLKEDYRRGIVRPLYTRVHTGRLPFLQDISDFMRNGMKREKLLYE